MKPNIAIFVALYGHEVNWKTLSTISKPVGTCHANKAKLATFRAMCALRAFWSPFCMAGTRAAAAAQSPTMVAPAYKCGPGKRRPVRMYVLTQPSIAMPTPDASSREPHHQCLSRYSPLIRSFRSCTVYALLQGRGISLDWDGPRLC